MVSGQSEPTLSVVVPIYNVEKYLDECLQSIVDQEIDDFEVIMVDDGSTDRSAEIAERWADRDERFFLVRQDNHGLGHARNTGMEHVTGTYLAFLDSDDVVGKGAYRRMIDTLNKTRSDFATGNVRRFDSSGRSWQAPLYHGMARVEELGTHVSRNPELLRDHLAHNKVWRTSFWRASGLSFPIGVLYEDVPAIIPAHVKATAVDSVPVVAVMWRIRDQGDSSITQNRRNDPRQLRDRVSGALTASRYIADHADQALKDEYDALVLRRDLRWYVDLYPEVSPDYQEEMFSAIGRFLAQVSPDALRRTPVAMRIAYALLECGARDDFAEYVRLRRSEQVDDLPVTVRDGRAYVRVDLPHHTRLPDDALDITDELVVASCVSNMETTEQDLVIEGWAYIPKLPIDKRRGQKLAVALHNERGPVPMQVTYRSDERAAAEVGAVEEATGTVAFTARLPLRRLRRRWTRRPQEWTVVVTVTNTGITCIAPMTKPWVGEAERPIMTRLRDAQWLRVCWKDDGLSCRVRREGAVVADIQVNQEEFVFSLRTHSPTQQGALLRVRSADGKGDRTYDIVRDAGDKRLAYARVRADELPLPHGGQRDAGDADGLAWNLSYRPSTSSSWQRVLDPVGHYGKAVTIGNSAVEVRRSRAATIDLVRGPVSPALTHAAWRDGVVLALRMEYSGASQIEAVVLRSQQRDEGVAFPAVFEDGEISAELPVDSVLCFGEEVPIRSGTWDLGVRTPAGDVPVRLPAHVTSLLPQDAITEGRRYSLTDRRRRNASLIVDTDLAWTERGPANQRRLQTVVYPSLKTGLLDAVLYETYYGKQFSDSPRAIFAELRRRDFQMEHFVVVRDRQFNVPDGATAVPYRSRRYFELLAQARYVIANTHLPSCFQRAPGQVVLQTWHGVGTKKIGLDMDAVHFANKAYIENIRNGEADNWSYLVSPNPFTSTILTRAFSYPGKLLETGAPRNDVFHRSGSNELADQVRERLGIAPGKKVVLYAPTWRDNIFDGPGRYRLDLRLDLYEAARKLGDDHVLVFRKHSNIIDRLPPGHGTVIDASDYPEVQELLLVTDILISDYSTLMCDFANTGRPMMFYTYDLANYRDVLRGFYFDFENEVPGPLVTSETDLISAILDADNVRVEYDAKYRAFAERFTPWDDGHATERVVDSVFGTSA